MNEELRQILEENNLSDYIEILEKEKIFSIEDMKDLSQDDYKELGITALGDRKKFLKLFKDDSSKETEVIKAVVVAEEQFVNTTRNGKKFCYKQSEPNKLYCPKCHSAVSEDSFICWNCNENLVEKSASLVQSNSSYSPFPDYGYSKHEESPNIVINNGGDSSSAAHTGLAGVLGGIIGAFAVIVIILIILSNESWTFTL